MRILVGLSTGEYIRKADFLPYFLGLQKPEGSLITTVHGQSPAKSRNIIIEQALAAKCSHVFFMDDDMAIPPDTLMKLAAHDKDVVTALYLMRSYPHFPVAFDMAFQDGYNKFMYLTPGKEGLVPITNCGLGCVLIKIEVFQKLEKPWVTLGELERDGWGDDINFFNKVRDAGFELFCDLNAPVGHMSSIFIWPNKTNGIWHSEYKHMNGNILFPQVIPSEEKLNDDIRNHGAEVASDSRLRPVETS